MKLNWNFLGVKGAKWKTFPWRGGGGGGGGGSMDILRNTLIPGESM